MDIIDSTQAVSVIVGGSSGYLTEFLPIFALVIGLAIAFSVISGLLYAIFGRKLHDDEEGV